MAERARSFEIDRWSNAVAFVAWVRSQSPEQLSADLTAAAKPLAMDYMTLNAVKSEIRMALISQKANACPMAARVAW